MTLAEASPTLAIADRARRLPVGARAAPAGDSSVVLCLDGLVAAVRGTPEGREAAVALAGPGEALPGGSGLLALTRSAIASVPAVTAPEAVVSLVARLEEAAAVAALGDASDRVAWWLLQASRAGPGVRLSVARVGLLAGVSRETASRIVTRLVGAGLVGRVGRSLVVADPGRLPGLTPAGERSRLVPGGG